MIEPGTLLQNRYLLNDKIGQGGMGAVYIATDQRFGSTVAVKETFFTDVNLRKAFEREARLLNSLRHNALPRVSDHFVEGEGQFLVMEFIGGDDLSTLLEKNKGPFPVDRVLGWAEQLLDALEYLHEQTPSIIHRDIKPQNLKLTDRDHIILLDFGLAKGAPSNLSRVTNTGSVFGYSRSYAPLEQIQGTGTDLRSDLYSLAATLYHLLTGVTPPDAVTRATAVINGQEDPMVPANEINPKVSPAVAAVLASALAQNANQRPASAREMRHALETADRTPGAGRVTAVVGNDSPTIHDQATQLLTPRTSPMTGAQAFVAAGAATVADPKLQGTGTDPRQAENTQGDSKVTVVATPAASAPPAGRTRRLAWAAAAIVLLGGSAFGIYRYTKQNQSPSPAPAQNVTVTAPTPQPSPSPVPAATPTPGVTETTAQKTKPTSVKPKPSGGNTVTVNDPDVEPPDPDDEGPPLPPPGRVGHRPPTGDPGEDERIRAAEERRRIMIQVQRDMQRRKQAQQRERERQRRQQQQNQMNRP